MPLTKAMPSRTPHKRTVEPQKRTRSPPTTTTLTRPEKTPAPKKRTATPKKRTRPPPTKPPPPYPAKKPIDTGKEQASEKKRIFFKKE